MKQNEIQSPSTTPLASGGLGLAQRVRGEAADAPAASRPGRIRAGEPRGNTPAASPPPVPGPDLLVPANAAPTAAPAADLLYDTAESREDATQGPSKQEREAAEQKRDAVLDNADARREAAALEAQRKALVIQDEAPQPAGQAALLVIDSDEACGASEQPGCGDNTRRRAIQGAAVAARLAGGDFGAPEESGERLHRVAVVAHLQLQQLRTPRAGRASSVSAPPPKTRAACERRCGHDGFCDPSDPLGCGGVHCGQQGDMLY